MCADWNQLFTDPIKIKRDPDPLVEELCGILRKRARVLDLGCGAGRHLLHLARKNIKACGSDLSPEGLRLSRDWMARENLSAHLLLSEMTALPFGKEVFDGALSVNVLNHATLSDGAGAVAEIRRILKRGAPFFFLIIGREDFRCGEGDEIEPFTFIHRQGIEAGVPHHFYIPSEIEQMAARFGRISIKERRRAYDPKDPIFGHDPRAIGRPEATVQHWEVRLWK